MSTIYNITNKIHSIFLSLYGDLPPYIYVIILFILSLFFWLLVYSATSRSTFITCIVLCTLAGMLILCAHPSFVKITLLIFVVFFLIQIAIFMRVTYRCHLMTALVLFFGFICACISLLISFTVILEAHNGGVFINVVSINHRDASGDYLPLINILRNIRQVAGYIDWIDASVVVQGESRPIDPNSKLLIQIYSIVEHVITDSMNRRSVENFLVPSPIVPDTMIYSKLYDFCITSFTKFPPNLSKYEADTEFFNLICLRYNITHTVQKPFLEFLANKIATDLLYLSIHDSPSEISNITILVGHRFSIDFNQLLRVQPNTAILLDAARHFSLSGEISIANYFGLLELLAGNMVPGSFTYAAALITIFGVQNLVISALIFSALTIIAVVLADFLNVYLGDSEIGVYDEYDEIADEEAEKKRKQAR